MKTVMRCPYLYTPDNGYVETGDRTVGTTVKYKCHKGYLIEGEAERTCLPNGSWSGIRAVCNGKIALVHFISIYSLFSFWLKTTMCLLVFVVCTFRNI